MVVASFNAWPWKSLVSFKYLLYGPLVAKFLYSRNNGDQGNGETWCLHILMICFLRGWLHQLWHNYSSMLFLTRSKKIIKRGADFKQIDDEWNWDNFLILQAFMATTLCYAFPSLRDLPLMNWKGFAVALLLHIGVAEPLYYWTHKQLHTNYFFRLVHSLHHSSPVPEPFTASHATLLEHLILSLIVGIPTMGPFFLGLGSTSLIYGYLLVFDFLRCMGHSNVEVLPHGLYQLFPFLKYLLYTPTYHSLHHKDMTTNFCLFMPLYDKLGNTLNEKSWDLHKKISAGEKDRAPDFVFLAHIVDIMSSLHVPFVFRSFSSLPFTAQLFLLPWWPAALIVVMLMWVWSKTFLLSSYMLKGRLQQTWVVPRCGFQYFLPFATNGINAQIEAAILRADRLGVKVISLAALNKNEALNGGGTLFVKKHPNLKVRVVHGNTLTAAVILNDIPKDCKEVFLTGSTSKLGRAIALYLCMMKVRVMMLTASAERFLSIYKEAPAEFQQYLIHVTKYQAGQSCKTWIVGKWLGPSKQRWASPGTHFYQFVVPPILPFRRDCTYGSLAAMRLPQDVEGLGSCEYTMERGVVHACHAGGILHCLEGWTHHEVGAIDVTRIDHVWEAALKHGFRPV